MSDANPEDSTSAQGGGQPRSGGNGSETPEQKQPAASPVIGTLPADLQQAMPAALAQGLETPEQKGAAATAVIGSLPADLQQAIPATLVRGMETPEQKQAAATAVIGSLPANLQQAMPAALVQGLETPEQKQAAATAVIGTLSADAKQQLAGALGSPDQRTRQVLWYLVVSTLTAAVFVFGTMAFVLVYQKKAADAPLALATAALGGIIGLVATSPGSRGSG